MVKKQSTKEKAELRKRLKEEFANKHPGVKSGMTSDEVFRMDTGQLWYVDKTKTFMFNQTRSHVENSFLVRSPRYPEVLESRRKENCDDKAEMERAKKESAKLVKEVLAEVLGMTEEEAQAHVYNMAKEEVESTRHPAYNAMVWVMGDLLKQCDAYMETLPIWGTKTNPGWLRDVKGIGTKLGAKLLCIVKDYQRFKRPSSLWAYFGVGDASKEKRVHGTQLHHSPKGRSLMYIMAESFIKQGTEPYRTIYDQRKEHTRVTHPEWHGIREEGEKNMHPKHADRDARRVMMKEFLKDFWLESWKADGKVAPSKPFEKAEAA
jgi:hypothetical protein